MSELEQIADIIRDNFEEVNTARDRAYQRSRQLTSICARAIRAIHREEWDAAEALIAQAQEAATTMVTDVDDYPMLYYA
ncbi:MAG: hypothetical protein KDE29_19635, partial [Anaerolineales bacterium]|nr:hypothetical protein [Anaerolineales bacterium]